MHLSGQAYHLVALHKHASRTADSLKAAHIV